MNKVKSSSTDKTTQKYIWGYYFSNHNCLLNVWKVKVIKETDKSYIYANDFSVSGWPNKIERGNFNHKIVPKSEKTLCLSLEELEERITQIKNEKEASLKKNLDYLTKRYDEIKKAIDGAKKKRE